MSQIVSNGRMSGQHSDNKTRVVRFGREEECVRIDRCRRCCKSHSTRVTLNGPTNQLLTNSCLLVLHRMVGYHWYLCPIYKWQWLQQRLSRLWSSGNSFFVYVNPLNHSIITLFIFILHLYYICFNVFEGLTPYRTVISEETPIRVVSSVKLRPEFGSLLALFWALDLLSQAFGFYSVFMWFQIQASILSIQGSEYSFKTLSFSLGMSSDNIFETNILELVSLSVHWFLNSEELKICGTDSLVLNVDLVIR